MLHRNSFFLLALTLIGCSSSPKLPPTTKNLDQVYLGPVRYRRPNAAPINPKEYPGSTEYERKQEVGDDMECKKIEEILPLPILKRITKCFQEQKESQVFKFKLLRHSMPEWDLQVQENTPNCFVEYLSFLPLPREVFFLADVEDKAACVNARIDIEKDLVLDAVLSETETTMDVRVALDDFPKTPEETRRLLDAWILSPFFNKSRKLPAKIVAKKFCQACFQDENILKFNAQELPKWP